MVSNCVKHSSFPTTASAMCSFWTSAMAAMSSAVTFDMASTTSMSAMASGLRAAFKAAKRSIHSERLGALVKLEPLILMMKGLKAKSETNASAEGRSVLKLCIAFCHWL